MTARRTLAVVAVVALAPLAHAETKAAPAVERDIVSSAGVELASLPAFEIPPMLKDTTGPTGSEATELVIGNAGEVERWRKAGPAGSSASFQLRVDGAPTAAITLGVQNPAVVPVGRDMVWVSCDPRQKRAFAPVRWETFKVDAQNKATWAIHDGFLDPRTCRVTRERTTEVRPMAVASFADHATVFAAREGDAVTFLLPTTDVITGDGIPASTRVVRGSMPRVTMSISKGSAASAAAFVDPSRFATWLAGVGAKDDSVQKKLRRGLTVRIEATQTVSEDAPTLFVRTSSGQ